MAVQAFLMEIFQVIQMRLEMIDNIHGIVITDWKMKVCEIAGTVGTLIERVQNILTHFNMKKLSAR